MPTLVGQKLLGLLPLDADDQGLHPIEVCITVTTIFAYFEGLVQAREIQKTLAYLGPTLA